MITTGGKWMRRRTVGGKPFTKRIVLAYELPLLGLLGGKLGFGNHGPVYGEARTAVNEPAQESMGTQFGNGVAPKGYLSLTMPQPRWSAAKAGDSSWKAAFAPTLGCETERRWRSEQRRRVYGTRRRTL